ncbi:MAG TPA: right-handed parallel beta-helix repeat-containing protein [Pyrinomonadaceae bacterium]|nr:right-handed parallel beta-helix repeat-containing protein [Pyrinomonadaceae bacterium]
MKKRALKTIARVAFGLTTLTALLLVLPQTSQSSQPININSCTTINSPGQYRLVADLTFNADPYDDLPISSTCITIGASNVDLNLNGHTITGPGGGSDGTAGISVTAKTMVDIKGPGVISSFGRGIDFDGVTSSDVKQVTATGNFFGFVVNNNSQGNLFRENTSTGNAQHGFMLNGAINNSFLNNVASNKWSRRNPALCRLGEPGKRNQRKRVRMGSCRAEEYRQGTASKTIRPAGMAYLGYVSSPVQPVTMSKATRPRIIIPQIWWMTTPTAITTRGPITSSTLQVNRASSSRVTSEAHDGVAPRKSGKTRNYHRAECSKELRGLGCTLLPASEASWFLRVIRILTTVCQQLAFD